MSGEPARRQALVRLSLSATDGEWATVHGKAVRRGLSISRYLVSVALADLSAATMRPAPALDGRDERRLLEAIRGLQPLLSEPDGPDAPEMPERVAALLQAWLSALARCRPGRGTSSPSRKGGRGTDCRRPFAGSSDGNAEEPGRRRLTAETTAPLPNAQREEQAGRISGLNDGAPAPRRLQPVPTGKEPHRLEGNARR